MPTIPQNAVYEYIRREYLCKGYTPKVSDIAQALCCTRRTIYRHLHGLASNKQIHLESGKIELQNSHNLISLPIRGKIAAGQPLEPIESHKVLDLSDLLLGHNRFVLQVLGNSMSGDHICDGDYIICERNTEAHDGDIVVALINESEATLKRYFKNADNIVTLQPSNPNLTPMCYPADNIKIQGVYLGLIRLTNSEKFEDCSHTTSLF